MSTSICLNFHGIGEPQRDLETGEAPYWISIDQFEKILDRVANAPQQSDIKITFDDGNLSDHELALPRLVERNLTARFFVLSGRLDQPGSLGKNDLSALLSANMIVGSHGIDHVPWPTLSDEALRYEVEVSRKSLEAACQTTITEAGIPFGRYDKRVLTALRRAGYAKVWSSDGGHIGSDHFLRARTSVRGDMSHSDLDAIFAGQMPFAKKLRRAIGMVRRRHFTTG